MVKKAKGKEWFTIIAPKMFEQRELGKTLASDPKMLIGRNIIVSSMDLMDRLGKYYMKFTFKIKRVEGDKAFTEFQGSECLRDYISRMILKRIRRIDTIQDLVTKDGIKIRFKGIATVSRKVKSSVEKNIRDFIKEMIKNEVENSNIDELVNKIISDDIKNKVIKEARKIYPLRKFEVRKTEVMG